MLVFGEKNCWLIVVLLLWHSSQVSKKVQLWFLWIFHDKKVCRFLSKIRQVFLKCLSCKIATKELYNNCSLFWSFVDQSHVVLQNNHLSNCCHCWLSASKFSTKLNRLLVNFSKLNNCNSTSTLQETFLKKQLWCWFRFDKNVSS